jgi:hypothetical protein
MLDANIAALNLAVMDMLVATPVTIGTVFAGVVSITLGSVGVVELVLPEPPPQAASKQARAATNTRRDLLFNA